MYRILIGMILCFSCLIGEERSFLKTVFLESDSLIRFLEESEAEERSPYLDYQQLTPKFGDILNSSLSCDHLELLKKAVLGTGPIAIVLKNCPVTFDVGPTPDTDRHSEWKKFQDEYFLLGLADVMNCIPWHESLEKAGEIIHQVIALKSTEHEISSNGSKSRLGFHTELPHYQRPIDFIVLLCLKDDPNAYTEIVDADKFVQGLPQEIVDEMLKAQFELKTGPSFKNQQSGVYSFLEKDPQGGYLIRFLSNIDERVVPKTPAAKKVLDYLRTYLENYEDYEKIYLKKGDCLILNNRKALHGRGSFVPAREAQDRRWLQRMYLYVNWRSLISKQEENMFFSKVPLGLPDSVFGLTDAFKTDNRSQKIDLLVGLYRDEELKATTLDVVEEAKELLKEEEFSSDYLPIDGLPLFRHLVGEIIFGKNLWNSLESRTYAAQTLGGTGALRIGSEFLFQEVSKTIYVPQPTWANHRQIFEKVGLQVCEYPYYNPGKKAFDCEAMCEKLRTLPPNTIVLLQSSCHNPTGRDPTSEQWREIFKTMQMQQLVPFFDCAYQGFGQGIDEDVESIRLSLEYFPEIMVAYACSKNFSLYNERIGALFVVTNNPSTKNSVGSQIRKMIRVFYSNPPATGARIVAKILNCPDLSKKWRNEVDAMRNRIQRIQQQFIQELINRSKTIDFSYLWGHLGLFMFLDLNQQQINELIQDHGVYLLKSGRISVSGMNQDNLDYIVESILKVSCSGS